MMAFPSMLLGSATEAGMKIPPNADDFDVEEYPHFNVFCIVQLGRRMNSLAEHWDNAKIIAAIPDNKIKSVTLTDLLEAGLSYAY